ncbi:hypothetical protein ACFV4K_10535 [Nocardia sp. NPDC059764]|uniref:hypothetical protein n=1 Tax=Nocardia sp. NPDC059764 TaxID=3346939 RepID=UPI0036629C77
MLDRQLLWFRPGHADWQFLLNVTVLVGLAVLALRGITAGSGHPLTPTPQTAGVLVTPPALWKAGGKIVCWWRSRPAEGDPGAGDGAGPTPAA